MDEFYQVDVQCGDVVTINGKNAYNVFNADMESLEILPSNVSADYVKKTGKSGLRLNDFSLNAGGIRTRFYVGGIGNDDSVINASNLLSECKDCIIKVEGDSFEYDAIMANYDISSTGVKFYLEASIDFVAIRRLQVVRNIYTTSPIELNNLGSVESGVKFTLMPKEDMLSATIAGIEVKNLDSGIPFIIDGLDGNVKSNGINRFGDTDIINFPKVTPGKNIIEFDGNMDVIVEYYPTFIF